MTIKKFGVFAAGVILVLYFVGCTSTQSPEDGDNPEAANLETEGGGGSAAGEGSESLDFPSDDVAGNNKSLDGELPPDPLDEKPKDSKQSESLDEKKENIAATPPPAAEPAPEVVATPPPAVEPAPEAASVTAASENPESKPVDPTGTQIAEEKPKPPPAPLKKIESTPFKQADILANAVYIARPGDSYSKIANMIYSDKKRAKDLKAVNNNKTVRPGEKIYYNSPIRPTDETKLATYYEDMGMTPESYTAVEGDNLRKIGKKLLGYENGWKEIWSTNLNLESKGKLAAGTSFIFWKGKGDETLNQTVAEASISDSSPPSPASSAPDIPLPPAEPQAIPTPPDKVIAASPDVPPPPPPPASPPPSQPTPSPSVQANTSPDLPPPPPPPPPPAAKPKKAKASAEAAPVATNYLEDTMTLGIAGAVIIIGAGGLIYARRRKQQREMSTAFNDTQVGT